MRDQQTVRTVLSLMALLIPAACASATGGQSGRDCSIAAADSVFVGAQPLFRECAVDTPAKRVGAVRIDFTPTTMPAQRDETCYTAEVQFVVGIDGRPEKDTIRLLRGQGEPFGDAVLTAMASWMYTTAVREGIPVRQLVRERHGAAVVVMAAPAGQAGARPPTPPDCR